MTRQLRLTENLVAIIRGLAESNDDPFYLYDTDGIRSMCRAFGTLPYAGTQVHYACMANVHPAFLRIVREEGLNIFVNSALHLEAAETGGFTGGQIMFAASAMSEATMNRIRSSRALVNLDSAGQIAQWRGLFPDTSFGIRCNIGGLVEAHETNGGYYIGRESRLGLEIEEIEAMAGDPHVEGLHIYAGTGICSLEYFRKCYEALARFARLFPNLSYLDFGGGFALDGDHGCRFDVGAYGSMTEAVMERVNGILGRRLRMIIEPGRIIGQRSAWYVCRVADVKYRGEKQLIGVNGSAVQFPRPLFYPDSARHPAALLHVRAESNGRADELSSIYGCSTYSRDFLARDILLPHARTGDIIVLGDAGAYCASAYTHFLGFPPAREIFHDCTARHTGKESGAVLRVSP